MIKLFKRKAKVPKISSLQERLNKFPPVDKKWGNPKVYGHFHSLNLLNKDYETFEKEYEMLLQREKQLEELLDLLEKNEEMDKL